MTYTVRNEIISSDTSFSGRVNMRTRITGLNFDRRSTVDGVRDFTKDYAANTQVRFKYTSKRRYTEIKDRRYYN